jgi:hypothetical protein
MEKASLRGRIRGQSDPGQPNTGNSDPAENLAQILADQEPSVVMKATLLWARSHEDEINQIKKEVLYADES